MYRSGFLPLVESLSCLKCILSKANGLWSSVVFCALAEVCVPLRALTGPVHQSIKSLLNLAEFQIWMRVGSAFALHNEIFLRVYQR